jgi:Flp pilus assembly protein TadD
MRFAPGALASMLVSTDARTFKEPARDWMPRDDSAGKDTGGGVAGSSQSLAGDLIREGVTGISANVSEPFLSGAVRPEILFPAYLAGFNLAESFYLALPSLSWQTVVIGDPLCAPFRKHVLTRAEIEEPVDPATELPALFSKRRTDVARVVMKDAPPKAVALFLRAEAQAGRGDKDGARRSLEEATEIAPGSVSIQLQLGLMYEEAGEWTKAMDRFRQVLKVQPKSVLALNNLAYSLAVRQKAPEEARPFALRAVALSPNHPEIVDTLAWIEHLLGNDREAARLLRQVVQKGTAGADIRLHAAIVFAAIGEDAAAEAQLKEALRLNPKLADREEAKMLRAQLGGSKSR